MNPMNLQQIEEQIKTLEAQRKQILDSQRASVLEETRKNVQSYGFTAAELGLGAGSTVVESSTRKPRRSSQERQAEIEAKHQASLQSAISAFESKIQVRKFTNKDTGKNRYYWNGKKGVKPNGDGVVVKNIDEII